jgi:hypothetical protein
MGVSILDAVKKSFTFEKAAEFQLSKNTADWNEQILNKFLEEVNYLPKEYSVEISMSNIDENKGYGKGSIMVWYGSKRVNFPIIIKDYKLSPFDIFVTKDGFIPLDINTLKKYLLSNLIGTVEDMEPEMMSGVKTPGGIRLKRAVSMDSTEPYRQQPNIEKISGLASKEDMEKFAQRLVYEPDLSENFHDNTGDLVTQLVDTVRKDYEVPRHEQKGILDLGQVIDAKDVIAVIDNELFDVNSLVPIKSPSVCELRMYSYPSMEDFLTSNIEKITAAKNGKSIAGIVLDSMDTDSFDNTYHKSCREDLKEEETKNRCDQVFISLDGKIISHFNDYDKIGIGFYGLPMKSSAGVLGKAIKMIYENTTNDFSTFSKDNFNDMADKPFAPTPEASNQSKKYLNCQSEVCGEGDLYVIYGAGDLYQAIKFYGKYKRVRVDGNYSYVSPDIAIIPSGVVSIQKVNSVKNAYYKMLVGNARNIFLIPESSIIVNTKFMKYFSTDNFMKPAKTLQKVYQEAGINKIAVYVGEKGYNISGKPVEYIDKYAQCHGLNTKEAMTILRLVGVKQDQATGILKTAINNALMDKDPVTIYGVRDDYINDRITPQMEKLARINELKKKYAESLRVDLVKEASVLTNPDAVDVILSLNFINENNLNDYVNQIPQLENVNSKLAELLVASRMGLSDMDEGALKKSINGLSSVIHGLENLKLSVHN